MPTLVASFEQKPWEADYELLEGIILHVRQEAATIEALSRGPTTRSPALSGTNSLRRRKSSAPRLVNAVS